MITALLRGLSRRRRPDPARSGTAVVPGRAGVPSIEYRPERDGAPDPGEVVWAWVAFEEDPTQGKDRPVLIIGRLGSMLAGIALTTKANGADDERVPVGTGSWDAARRPSYAKIDRVLTIDPASVRREGATFERDRFNAVVELVARRHRVDTAGAGSRPRAARP